MRDSPQVITTPLQEIFHDSIIFQRVPTTVVIPPDNLLYVVFMSLRERLVFAGETEFSGGSFQYA